MSAVGVNVALADRIAQEHAAAAAAAATPASGGGLPTAVVSAEQRARAIELLRTSGLPTTRDDNWKYANLRGLEKNAFRSVAAASRRQVAMADLPAPIAGYARYVFVDGAFAADLSAATAHAGVTVRSVASSAAPTGNAASDRSGSAGDERFALLNDAFAIDAALVHAPKGADCAACVEILFVATETAQNAASHPRLELQVDANARVGLIERHISLGSDANFVNGAVQVNIAP